jgi:hypothetical protein
MNQKTYQYKNRFNFKELVGSIDPVKIKVAFIALILILAILPVGGWNITTDSVSSTSIAWNVSDKPGVITSLSYDGITITDFDPDATVLIQSGLYGNETHNIRVVANSTNATASATTSDTTNDAINKQIDKWIYLFIILICFLAGMVLPFGYVFSLLGSGVSLYAIAEYIQKVPNPATDIWNIQFYVYLFMFVFGFILVAFRKRK